MTSGQIYGVPLSQPVERRHEYLLARRWCAKEIAEAPTLYAARPAFDMARRIATILRMRTWVPSYGEGPKEA